MQQFLDSLPTQFSFPEKRIVINWSVPGTGFGQYIFYTGKDGNLHCANECMNKESIKAILNKMVDKAILDD